MHLTLFTAPKGYEMALSPALIEGMRLHGDTVTMKPTEDYRGPEGDAGIIFGVVKREILWDHVAKGVPLLYLDKGYVRDRASWNGHRTPKYWRMCWNATHPTAYLMAHDYSPNRWMGLGMPLFTDRSNPNGPVVILGSSQKFHHTHHLPHPTEWARDVRRSIPLGQEVIYRPKPSWRDAEAIPGATFVHGDKTVAADTLAGARCSVTFGSIACVDSLMAGIPCLVLGNAVSKSLCNVSSLDELESLQWPGNSAIQRWGANLAYHQWTPPEIEDGTAWSHAREQLKYAIGSLSPGH